MVEIKFFGLSRSKIGKSQIDLEADSIKKMIKALSNETGLTKRQLKQNLIFVNEVNIQHLKMWKTKLNDGDKITFFTPSSGG